MQVLDCLIKSLAGELIKSVYKLLAKLSATGFGDPIESVLL